MSQHTLEEGLLEQYLESLKPSTSDKTGGATGGFDVSNLFEQAGGNPLGLPNNEAAVQSQIDKNTRSSEEVTAAFQAMRQAQQQAQQPSKFDKISGAVVGAGYLFDVIFGKRDVRRGAAGKFKAFQGSREEKRQAKQDRLFDRFIQQMKLREFTGDISNKNLGLALGVSERKAERIKSNFDALITGITTKASVEKSGAETEKIKRPEKPGATPEQEKAAALKKIDEDVLKYVTNQIGKFFDNEDLWQRKLEESGYKDSGITAEQFYIITRDRWMDAEKERRYRAAGFAPPKKSREPGALDQSAKDLPLLEFNPADFLPAIEGVGADEGEPDRRRERLAAYKAILGGYFKELGGLIPVPDTSGVSPPVRRRATGSGQTLQR